VAQKKAKVARTPYQTLAVDSLYDNLPRTSLKYVKVTVRVRAISE
jgi:hypothetical protein